MIRVLHLTAWPIPDSLAGTEIYILSLSGALRHCGVESIVGCLDSTPGRQSVTYDGIDIAYFQSLSETSPASFQDWVRSFRPDIVNVHAITGGLGLDEVRAVKELGLPVVLTVHLAGLFCQRGTMMLNGEGPCDGELIPERCAACYGQRQGLPVAVSTAFSRLPPLIRRPVAACCPSRLSTLLNLPEQLANKKLWFDALIEQCDRVVAVCQWLMDSLGRNGVSQQKLRLSRQATDSVPESQGRRTPHSDAFRIGYIGRYYPVKGVHTIIEAVRKLSPELPVQLLLRGSVNGAEDEAYFARLKELAGSDPRIELGGRLDRPDLSRFFADIDCLAVPSTWLETGPIVVYEAIAHGTPVLGSRLGGIAELIDDGRNGYLVPAGNAAAWADRIRDLVTAAQPVPSLGRVAASARTWPEAANEMTAVYHEAFKEATGRLPAAACG